MKKTLILFALSILIFFSFISENSRSIQNIFSAEKKNQIDQNINLLYTIPLKKGDIVWRWVDPELFPLFQYFTHPLLFTGSIQNNTYEFIEAHGGRGVTYTYYTEQQIKQNDLLNFAHRLTRETSSEEIIENALLFAHSRLDQNDKFVPLFYFNENLELRYHEKNQNPNDETDPLSNKWYCTELIWAAFMNQGINIDFNDG
ncbi:MAG: hypothetical protein KGY50_01610, partial [Candidatus Thermoplasmatota archaeon]|nr:hypothetical protein [Candidatus Thermoplasmatota archaeon]